MRELRGAADIQWDEFTHLKRYALLFDGLYCSNLDELLSAENLRMAPGNLRADYEFLRRSEVIIDPAEFLPSLEPLAEHDRAYLKDFVKACEALGDLTDHGAIAQRLVVAKHMLSDLGARLLSTAITNRSLFDVVPICKAPIPDFRGPGENAMSPTSTVLMVALASLPVPNDQCSWQDILDFKNDTHDKQWGFRRWMHALATKHQTEGEVRDDLEWSLNEYTEAMKLHKIKASQSFLDVFVISPLEIMENLVKFNWSKIAKGALQVRKRDVELMEAELKAPGRECAYIFDARRRFGKG
jgi:hypothetical protein